MRWEYLTFIPGAYLIEMEAGKEDEVAERLRRLLGAQITVGRGRDNLNPGSLFVGGLAPNTPFMVVNALGRMGWELVGFPDNNHWAFKRPC